jgi:hypothetical protein
MREAVLSLTKSPSRGGYETVNGRVSDKRAYPLLEETLENKGLDP